MKLVRSIVSGVLLYATVTACGALATSTAKADSSPEPEVAVEACNKSFEHKGARVFYAEHAYPGATEAELAVSVTVLGLSNGFNVSPPGYRNGAVTAWYQDGLVSMICGGGAFHQNDDSTYDLTYASATFVRRR